MTKISQLIIIMRSTFSSTSSFPVSLTHSNRWSHRHFMTHSIRRIQRISTAPLSMMVDVVSSSFIELINHPNKTCIRNRQSLTPRYLIFHRYHRVQESHQTVHRHVRSAGSFPFHFPFSSAKNHLVISTNHHKSFKQENIHPKFDLHNQLTILNSQSHQRLDQFSILIHYF